jgi:hypothetical protein
MTGLRRGLPPRRSRPGGAAVIADGEIAGLAISCQALGMGVEHSFVRHVLGEAPLPLRGCIVPTPRNISRAEHLWRRLWQFARPD